MSQLHVNYRTAAELFARVSLKLIESIGALECQETPEYLNEGDYPLAHSLDEALMGLSDYLQRQFRSGPACEHCGEPTALNEHDDWICLNETCFYGQNYRPIIQSQADAKPEADFQNQIGA